MNIIHTQFKVLFLLSWIDCKTSGRSWYLRFTKKSY